MENLATIFAMIEEWAPLVIAVIIPLAALVNRITNNKYEKHADLLIDAAMQVVQGVKVARGLSGDQARKLAKEVVSGALGVDKLKAPALIDRTIASIDRAYKAAPVEALKAAPTMILEANTDGKKVGAALRGEFKRAVAEISASGIPGKGIDGSQLAARVALELGRIR